MMKHLASLSLFTILFASFIFTSSCTKEEPGSSQGMEEENLYNTLDCSTLFDTGNYSDLCNLDMMVPASIIPTPVGEFSACSYLLGNESEAIYDLQIEFESSPTQAQDRVDEFIISFESESINNLGDKAFYIEFSPDEEGNLGIAVIFSNSNAYMRLISIYDPAVEQACSHDRSEMTKFAQELLNNL